VDRRRKRWGMPRWSWRGSGTSASSALRWLDRQAPEISNAQQMLEHMVNDSTRTADIIRGLRAMAKKSEPEFAVFDINEASREVLEVVRNRLEDGNIEVVGNLAMLRWVNGDRVQLQQVILNLVMNAVDAMRETTGRPRRLFISSRPRTRAGSELKWGIQGRESIP
jgi:C4-dicarboxylate-specific signal transduction histidine kinase